MKLVFWTNDQLLQDIAAQIESEDVSVCSNSQDLGELISRFGQQNDSQERVLFFLDPKTELDSFNDLAKKIKALDCASLILFLESEEIKSVEQSNYQILSPSAFLDKQISIEDINDFIDDFRFLELSEKGTSGQVLEDSTQELGNNEDEKTFAGADMSDKDPIEFDLEDDLNDQSDQTSSEEAQENEENEEEEEVKLPDEGDLTFPDLNMNDIQDEMKSSDSSKEEEEVESVPEPEAQEFNAETGEGLEFNIPTDDSDGVGTDEIMKEDSSEVLATKEEDSSEQAEPEQESLSDEATLEGLKFGATSEETDGDEALLEKEEEVGEQQSSAEDDEEGGLSFSALSNDDEDEVHGEIEVGPGQPTSEGAEENSDQPEGVLSLSTEEDDGDDFEIETTNRPKSTSPESDESLQEKSEEEDVALDMGQSPLTSDMEAPEVSEDNGLQAQNEDSTGEFDMEGGLSEQSGEDENENEDQDEATRATQVASLNQQTESASFNQELEDQLTDTDYFMHESSQSQNVSEFSPSETETDVDAQLSQQEQSSEKTQRTRIQGKSDSKAALKVTPNDERLPEAFKEEELSRQQATIRQLREERDSLLSEVEELKDTQKMVGQDNLSLKAELEEAKIEVNILRKRHADEIDEMQYRLRVSEEKKSVYEEKSKHYQRELERLGQKVRIDFNKVKQREKELESQLELVSMDSESQVRSRDEKILELKRKIDQLEFNMENSHIREQKYREDKVKLEERLTKIMKTLRGSIKVLENDLDMDEEILEKIKKM